MKNRSVLILLFLLLLLLYLLGLTLGSVSIPLADILSYNDLDPGLKNIILKVRHPRSIVAILAGSSLALAGLFLQTLFRNPLAGPSVLGISSGASLGVAAAMLGGGLLSIQIGSFGIVSAAILGSLLVLLLITMISIRYSDVTLVLIAGLMLGFLSSSIVSVLAFFSDAELLKPYVHWGFGSFSRWTDGQITMLMIALIIMMILASYSYKALNAFLMGENFASSIGINSKKHRNIIIIATGITTGIVTAYCGPIAFLGLAVPQLVKIILKSNHHRDTIPYSILLGAIIALSCDIISRVPGKEIALPLNAITSLFGAPIVLYVLFRAKRIKASLS